MKLSEASCGLPLHGDVLVDVVGMTAFVAVVSAGSFTRAAQELGTSKSVVSRRIGEVESKLGLRLIDRSAARVSPTEAGSAYYVKCLRILEAIEEANDHVASYNGEVRGSIVVSVPSSLCAPIVSRLIAEFALAYPDLKLTVDIEERESSVRNTGFDVAVRCGDLADSSLVGRVISHSTSLLCASPAYLELNGAPTSVDMLKDHYGLLSARGEMGVHWQLRDGGQLRTHRVRERMRSGCIFHLLEAAKAGLGIAQLPDYLVAGALQKGELLALLPRCTPSPSPISLVYPASRKASQKVRLLIDFLAERFLSLAAWRDLDSVGIEPGLEMRAA